jgi:peptidoglycan/xylan/chitin deacetylase (PgdA/CDA1 family)
MRLLLLGLTGQEPAFLAWAEWLANAGAVFDAVALNDPDHRLVLVDDSGDARFQAIIQAEAGLLQIALDPAQRAQLERIERHHGLRRLTAYSLPTTEMGLSAPHYSGPLTEGQARVTAAGRVVFPYLRDRLPVDPGSWAHLARPIDVEQCEPLIADDDGGVLVGIHRSPDGREEMVQTFSVNSIQAQGQILRRGQLHWLTRGIHLGLERHYLSVHVDDVLLANYSWNLEHHESESHPARTIRMSAEDARETARWSRDRGMVLGLACNGAGAPAGDPLLEALLTDQDAFRWLNHTYEHRDLDVAGPADVAAEIERNRDWASEVGIDMAPDSLITGSHTGLANLTVAPPRPHNPALIAALQSHGIRYLAADASRPYPAPSGDDPLPAGTPFLLGTTMVVPRHPTALPHDAATGAQVLDRLRTLGGSADSYSEVADAEARRVFKAVIGNDPRPHYFHQSNLIGARLPDAGESAPALMLALLDAVLERYRAHVVGLPLCQPTMPEVGRLLHRRQAWAALAAHGSVDGFIDRRRVYLVNATGATAEMPLTGTSHGDEYGESRSGWILVPPGETVLERQTLPERRLALVPDAG